MEIIDIKITRERFNVVECSGCSLKYTNPRPDYDEIGPYYGESYYSYRQPNAQKVELEPTGKKFLDYGCGVMRLGLRIIPYLSEDRYVGAALELFASVALLFWYVLQLLLSLSRSD